MPEILLEIAPTFLTFALGLALRRLGFCGKAEAAVFLKLVFNVSLPALILLQIPAIELTARHAWLPAIAVLTALITFLLARWTAPRLATEVKTIGTGVVAAIIMNIGFVLPFVVAVYGSEGFTILMLFDSGNAFMALTLAYVIACRYGRHAAGEAGEVAKRLAQSPPLWALALAVLMNAAGIEAVAPFDLFLESIGGLTFPLIMLAMGIYFVPQFKRPALLASIVAIRMGGGLLCGWVFAMLFGIDGLARAVVMVCAAAPAGFNTLTYAAITGLDSEFAASVVTFSVGAGLLVAPLLLMLL